MSHTPIIIAANICKWRQKVSDASFYILSVETYQLESYLFNTLFYMGISESNFTLLSIYSHKFIYQTLIKYYFII